MEQLGVGLDDAEVFQSWVKVYDRVAKGEMPPSSEPKPPADEASDQEKGSGVK